MVNSRPRLTTSRQLRACARRHLCNRRCDRRMPRRCPVWKSARGRGQLGKHRESLRRQSDRRSNEIVVKTGFARGFDYFGQVAPRRRFTAGKMYLQHAEASGFAEYTRPRRGVEFVVALVERQRIGTIRTAEWATVRQFGEQAEGRRQTGAVCRHARRHRRIAPRARLNPISNNFFSANPPSSFTTSA